MPLLHYETPWQRKPPPGVSLDSRKTDGIQVYYALNESGGDRTHDLSRGLNPGTLTNSPTWKNGSLHLGGSSQKILIADSDSLSMTSNMTMAGWFKFDNLSGSRCLIRKGSSGGTDITFLWYWKSSGPASLSLFTGAGASEANFTPVVGRWHHLACVVLADNKIQNYADGVLLPNSTDGTPTWSDDADPWNVGDWSSFDFVGDIDQLIVWNRILNSGEIALLRSNPWRYHQPALVPLGVAAAPPDVFIPLVMVI